MNPIGKRFQIEWDDSVEDLAHIIIPPNTSDTRPIPIGGIRPAPASEDTLRRLFPHFKTKKARRDPTEYKLLFAFEWGEPEVGVCIKGALQHRQTGKIAHLSCTNVVPTVTHFPSIAEGWFVHGAEQIAPSCYWKAFRNVT